MYGIFSELTLGYSNYLFLTASARQDRSSTLPVANNTYLYPAISTSFIFTDAFNLPKNIINFGKIRANYAKVGKDADIVIWSDTPLSVNAKAEQTFIDGILFYDIRKQSEENMRNDSERSRIVSLILEAVKAGEKTVPYKTKKQPHYHCDTEENETDHVH